MSTKKAPVHLTRDQILDYLWKWAPEKISATNKTAPHLVAMLPSEDGSFKAVELNRLTISAAAGYYLRFRMLRKKRPEDKAQVKYPAVGVADCQLPRVRGPYRDPHNSPYLYHPGGTVI